MCRYCIILCSLFCFLLPDALQAQQGFNYTQAWKKAEELASEKGLPVSALKEVEQICKAAKNENNDGQFIKALLFRADLKRDMQENTEVKTIKEFEVEIQSAAEPLKSVLSNLLAEAYWQYLQNNRWKFYDRTTTKNFQKDSIDTWSVDDFHEKISSLYLASLQAKEILQQTKVGVIDAVIEKGNTRNLRPTLFDLLAFNALLYFESDESGISKFADSFIINDSSAFAPASDFIQQDFLTTDSLSLPHQALLLYRQLIAFHINDKSPDALVDVDIHRLTFVNSKFTGENKTELYQAALTHIIKQYNRAPITAQASYRLAKEYADLAGTYNFKKAGTEDQSRRYFYQKAAAICKEVLAQKEETEGQTNCFNLLQTIQAKNISLAAEQVNIPGKPFRALVTYRNLSNAYFRVVAVSKEVLRDWKENHWQDSIWKNLANLPARQEYSYNLPADDDHQEHSTEIKVRALPVGMYALIASCNKDFLLKKNRLAVQFFHVSNIAPMQFGDDFVIVNRESGRPLQKASGIVWQHTYDYKRSKYILSKKGTYQTDTNGYFHAACLAKDWYSYTLEISYLNDHLHVDDRINSYVYRGNSESGDKERTFLFTDRSIYRPGQTVYFKGITCTQNNKTRITKVLKEYEKQFTLYDANRTEIERLSIKSNEFGSFTGKFVLPSGHRAGEYSIREYDNDLGVTFSVEEYKRPKFYIEYLPIKQSFKINDSIKVTGIAKDYAGNNNDGATVKYRIVREPQIPHSWLCWWWGSPYLSVQEIAAGITKTNADGTFSLTFKAIPDREIRRELEPEFHYRIIADVTDRKGETRSAVTEVTVAYKALRLQLDIPKEAVPADSLKSVILTSKNWSGEFIESKVTLSIYKLKAPDRLIRPRYWEPPDQFVLGEKEFLANFPNDPYKNESKKETWPVVSKVFERTENTRKDSLWALPHTNFEPGWYLVEAVSKDSDGEEVKDRAFLQLINPKTKQAVSPEYVWASPGNISAEIGQKASVLFGSGATDVYVVQSGLKEEKPFVYHKLNNEQKKITIPVTEKERGGFGYNFSFVKHNRFFAFTRYVDVLWSDKTLTIGYESFRDKTLPGSKEEWKVKISGYKKDTLTAEVLTAMYDASLDQFRGHNWSLPDLYPVYYFKNQWSSTGFRMVTSDNEEWGLWQMRSFYKSYDQLRGFCYLSKLYMYSEGAKKTVDVKEDAKEKHDSIPAAKMLMKEVVVSSESMAKEGIDMPETSEDRQQVKESQINNPLQVRKKFSETAFFFPQLKTDEKGEVSFQFTMPESLTRWKWQLLAHTKDLSFAISKKFIVTQKELMVQSFAPRFLREGDKFEFSAKISNLSSTEIKGTSNFHLINSATGQPVDVLFQNRTPVQSFRVAAGQSTVVKFETAIPYNYTGALTYRVVAERENSSLPALSDGEEATIPVLTNRMLVTESLPLHLRGDEEKNFEFKKLLHSAGNGSSSLAHHKFTLEYSSNPVWYAVQALPYLMEFPFECAEQIWNRFYANALAASIVKKIPRIQKVFNQWKNSNSEALQSNLEKNEELKSVLLQETPWVLEAKNEEKQKKNTALLFDLVRMSNELNKVIMLLKEKQAPGGGFMWFKGCPADRFITQYIVTGIGHLQKLNALPEQQKSAIQSILEKAIPYLDKEIKQDYDNLWKDNVALKDDNLSYTQIQYLYMRSFFKSVPIPSSSQTAYKYYLKQSRQYWLEQSKYMQGMIALALFRNEDTQTAVALVNSLKESALSHAEMGMYWKEFTGGYYWYQAPVEAQALMIEVFNDITNDQQAVTNLKTWLLKQKQTQNWKTTMATAEACYALLLNGDAWVEAEPVVKIKAGDQEWVSGTATADQTVEAGTGHFKRSLEANLVASKLGKINVTVKNSNGQPSWGAAYWQYFEDLDKITGSETGLQLKKQYFVENNTAKGPVLTPVDERSDLKVGDKIKVRIELRVDRNLEYVHMKDMRPACMEPVNVISQYKWQDGLGYYESTGDAGTHFFISRLNKGNYVFEYPLFVTHAGNYSSGVATIQCMYAPEFTSHSEGVRVKVKGER